MPVNVLVVEIKKALPMVISGLGEHSLEVSSSLKTLEKFYRWTFYIEMICRLLDRHMTDKNLNIMNYLQQYMSVFIRYEEILPHRDESFSSNLR
jgi:hypothetical protein